MVIYKGELSFNIKYKDKQNLAKQSTKEILNNLAALTNTIINIHNVSSKYDVHYKFELTGREHDINIFIDTIDGILLELIAVENS